MLCFIMKALTLDGEWFPFTIADIPTRFNKNEFALLGRPGTPRLQLRNVRRGDPVTGLYEGDIISYDNDEWLVCYERGFYVINRDYTTKHLYMISDFELLGDNTTIDFPVPSLRRNKVLFKYNDVIFRLEDIVGSVNGDLILRSVSKPVPIGDVRQECGMSYNNNRIYFGDKVDVGKVDLRGGRIAVKTKEGYIDLATGGKLDACVY